MAYKGTPTSVLAAELLSCPFTGGVCLTQLGKLALLGMGSLSEELTNESLSALHIALFSLFLMPAGLCHDASFVAFLLTLTIRC